MSEIALAEEEVVDDVFPNGFKIIQNEKLYRFTSDSVLLARFARVKAGDVVADFCAGSGIVGLHFYAEHPALVKAVTFFEVQPELSEMSKKSIALNGLEGVFTAVNRPVQELGNEYAGAFSLILCNPPYEGAGGFENADPKKAVCRKEKSVTLGEIAATAAKCLKFGGRLALCHRADRAAEVFYTLHEYGLEPKRLQFVAGKEGKEPYLLLMEAVRGGKTGLKVLPTAINQK